VTERHGVAPAVAEAGSDLADEAVATQLALDMVKRAVPFAPAVVALCWLAWGSQGAWSALLAVGVVAVNLLLLALSLSWAARISPAVLMGAALGGFLVRMTLVTIVVVAVKDLPWVDLTALAVAILVTHLGLLIWETRYVSASLAFPGLAPSRKGG